MVDFTNVLSKTVCQIKPSGIRRFFDLASEMDNVISLGVGEPDFSTPWHIRNEGIENLRKGKTWYTANAGLPELRKELSDHVKRKYGMDYDPKTEILVTVGGSEAIDLTVRALLDPGDEVIIPQPSFVCYEPITQLAGGKAVIVDTKAENEFRLTAEELRAAITPRTKLLILPFPNNPTGAIMGRKDLEAIADVIRETDIIVLSDEIYAELTYGEEKHISFASLEGMWEHTVLINGFSKAYAMTGWRLGYACGPEPILRQMTKIHQFGIMSAPTTSQLAAIEALRNGDEDVEEMRREYDTRRKLLLTGFRRMGLPCFEPKGAFYMFPDIRRTRLSSEEFCEALLKEKRVAVVPGTAFGESGEGFVRVSYCYSTEHLMEAMKRMEEFLRSRVN